MHRAIVVSELRRRKAAMESDIVKIDGAIAVLEAGIQKRHRNGAKAAVVEAASAPKRRRGRPLKVTPASLAEVAE